ncbi:hypothetical protein [Marinisporobacter balticus]|uniref:Uncharacterized protein n=1 Tax=Marinisporobacter balticus TaxID=2018667 RepID=A0A4V6NPF4_9FIRM|nr:hypothetical protein [Marinisporobacter balticus]TCO76920.1 hypothetical protein EV214_10777 [Marinisporobacter balticus]
MKKYGIFFTMIISLFLHSVSFAQTDVEGWRYYKEIDANDKSEYKTFFLDKEIYRHAKNDLGDIRISNEKNEFIPYYIYNEYLSQKEEIKIKYQSNEILSFIKENNQYTDFKIIPLKEHEDLLGNQLTFDINQARFMKNVTVYGGHDDKKWDFIKNDYLYRTDTAEKLNISLDESYKYDYYRIVFLNDIENTNIKALNLVFDQKKVIYESYQKEENVDFKEALEGRNTTILIENKDRLKINNIKINSEDDYKRDYTISYRDKDGEFRMFGNGEIYQISLKNFHIEENNIHIDEPTNILDTLKIQIHNQDNKPINIEDIAIRYYTDKVVFKGTKGKYKILFNNKLATRPDYDIESYKNYIEKEEQEICKLSTLYQQQNKATDEQKKINYKWMLNIMIIMISIGMILLIIKKSGFKDVE